MTDRPAVPVRPRFLSFRFCTGTSLQSPKAWPSDSNQKLQANDENQLNRKTCAKNASSGSGCSPNVEQKLFSTTEQFVLMSLLGQQVFVKFFLKWVFLECRTLLTLTFWNMLVLSSMHSEIVVVHRTRNVTKLRHLTTIKEY